MLTTLQMPWPAGASPAACLLALVTLAGCGDAMLRRGHDALGQGRYREAISAFADVEGRLPAKHPRDARQSAHRSLATELFEAGGCDEGRAQLVVAESFGPALLADHRRLYDCVSANPGPPAQRLADLERLMALGEQRVDVRLQLMRLLLDAARWPEAVAHVPLLERRYALTLSDHEVLIGAWERAGRLVGARPHLLKVLQVRPDDLLARLKLAEVEEARGDQRAAAAIYRRLETESPDNPAIQMRLAAFYRRVGNPVAARAAMERARRLQNPTDDPRGELRPLPKSRR